MEHRQNGHASQTSNGEHNVRLPQLKNAIEQVEAELSSKDYMNAISLSDHLLETYPNNDEVVALSATCALEVGDQEKALQLFTRSIEINSEADYSRYCSRAQLQEGEPALCDYKKAVLLLNEEINNKESHKNEDMDTGEESDTIDVNSEKSVSELLTTLCQIYCSIAELFITDLCDEKDAEQQFSHYCDLALQTDSDCLDAHIIKAKYLKIVEKFEDAEKQLQDVRQLWFPNDDYSNIAALQCSTKIALAKLLMELSLHDDADTVLDCMSAEDDKVVEVHYYLGWNRYLQGPDNFQDAAKHLVEAKECEEENPCEDPQLIAHIDELLAEIGSDGYETLDDEDEEAAEEEILHHSED